MMMFRKLIAVLCFAGALGFAGCTKGSGGGADCKKFCAKLVECKLPTGAPEVCEGMCKGMSGQREGIVAKGLQAVDKGCDEFKKAQGM